MRLVVQRVLSASVTVEKETVAKSNNGMLVFVGFKQDDTQKDMEYCVSKLLNLRIFSSHRDESKEQNIVQINGEILLVSQFTLYANCKKGNRPSFSRAMPADNAREMYEQFVNLVRSKYSNVQSGVFQAYMQVALINDGPVTILVDSEKLL